MYWLIVLTIITYFRTLFNGFISDDITVSNDLKKDNYPIRWDRIKENPVMFLHDWQWRICKQKSFPHHLINLVLYAMLVCSFYLVGQKYFPEPIMFLATLFFIVHPCNGQIVGWISGRFYMVAGILGLWALYFNNIALYLLTPFAHPTMLPMPVFMNLHWSIKILSVSIALFYMFKVLKVKADMANSEGSFKIEGMRLYPRKIIVALKSFIYYFTIALFPTRMGWFHIMGEPIDEKLKSWNFQATLSVLLIGAMFLFWGTPAFKGLVIFTIFILPFTNILTFALFTSERYMTPAIMGWSIFLAYTLKEYPVVSAILITAYFMRTQLELWAYQDDFHLALYSLLNFKQSGFAWANMVNLFMNYGKPSAAFDTIHEGIKRQPEFPTLYYQMYLMYRSTDLLCDMDKAMEFLEKACHWGKHEKWYEELNGFRKLLKQERIKKFKENVARHKFTREFRPVITQGVPDISKNVVGITA